MILPHENRIVDTECQKRSIKFKGEPVNREHSKALNIAAKAFDDSHVVEKMSVDKKFSIKFHFSPCTFPSLENFERFLVLKYLHNNILSVNESPSSQSLAVGS